MTEETQKANELIEKFGYKSIDVVDEIINEIPNEILGDSEDGCYFYKNERIDFWQTVRKKIIKINKQINKQT